MALPELLPPAGTPRFHVEGHAIAPDTLYDDIEPMQGERRKRRVQTYAPRTVSVSTIFEADEAYAYDEWYENVLIVGSAKFTAHVGELGPNSKYWAAEWVDPPQWEAMTQGRWRLSGQLLLTGEGADAPPATVTLAFEFGMALTGTASIASPVDLAFEFGMALESHNPIAFEFAMSLEAVETPEYFERETASGGGFIERETGGTDLGRE